MKGMANTAKRKFEVFNFAVKNRNFKFQNLNEFIQFEIVCDAVEAHWSCSRSRCLLAIAAVVVEHYSILLQVCLCLTSLKSGLRQIIDEKHLWCSKTI